MKTNDIIGRYIWLVDLLYQEEELDLKQIQEAWRKEYSERAEYSERTFHRDVDDIADLLGIHIIYDRSSNKWLIDLKDDFLASERKKELMSVISMNNAVREYGEDVLENRILYEEEPRTKPEWIRQAVKAMSMGKKLSIKYKSLRNPQGHDHIVAPFCIKMYKRRWYLLARVDKEENPRTFCLDDRMLKMEETDYLYKMPENFDAKAYFKDAFGITTGRPAAIKIKTYGVETQYWRSAPLHPSQKEIETHVDYSVFQLAVPTHTVNGIRVWEFYQELFSRIDQIEVLEPDYLRRDMEDYARKIIARYDIKRQDEVANPEK